jgi:phosphoribosyl isomerase A
LAVTFTLLPAVDVAGGQSVRLEEGDAGTATSHGDPFETALAWRADGAEWIHLVDLDAAFGRGSNAELLADIIRKLDIRVELSGGIRDATSLEQALSTGCERVILATNALDDLLWCARAIADHGGRIAIALDVRIGEEPDGSARHRLAARGGSGDNGDLWETMAFLDRVGCSRYVVTDVSRDGTLGGPNVELYKAVARATNAAVIASGGISTITDLEILAKLATENANLEGLIVGKALYAGRFTLTDALNAMRRADVGR